MEPSSLPLTPIEAEARQLGLRYDSFTRTPNPVTNEFIYRLVIKPTEPDLPFPISMLSLEFTVPSSYPVDLPVGITVRSPSLPKMISDMFSTYLMDYVRSVWKDISLPLPSSSVPTPPRPSTTVPTTGPSPLRSICKWIENTGTGVILRKIIQEQQASSLSSTTRSPASTEPAPDATKDSISSSSSSLSTATGSSPSSSTSSSSVPSNNRSTVYTTVLPASTDAIFSTQDKWTLADQQAYEYAIYEYVIDKHRSLYQPETWSLISQKIHDIIEQDSILTCNNNHPVNTKSLAIITPETCLARYLVLRKLCSNWLHTLVPTSLLHNPELGKNQHQRQQQSAFSSSTTVNGSSVSTSGTKKAATTVTKTKGGRYADQKISLTDLDNDNVINPLPLTTVPPVTVAPSSSSKSSAKPVTKPKSSMTVPIVTKHPMPSPSPSTTLTEPIMDMFGRVIDPIEKMKTMMTDIHEDNDEDYNDDDEDDEEDDDEYTEEEEDDESSEGNDNNETQEHMDDDDEPEPILPLQNIHLVTPHRGTQLLLDRLSIFGIGTLAATSISVLTQCDRCSTVMSASITGASLPSSTSSNKSTNPSTSSSSTSSSATSSSTTSNEPFGTGVWKCWCPKCSLLLSLAYRPMLVHDGNPSLGYVDCGNCSIVSLSYAYMILSCLECNTFVEHNPPRLTPPMVHETTCRTCYSRLRFDAHGFTAQIATKDNDQSSGLNLSKQEAINASISLSQRKRSQRFTAGHPLPQEGTCVHYKKSYRWLRFPCCNLAFPCDKCHDNNSDHPHEWANRMICGHCAREQPFVMHGACVSCGESMTRTMRNTGFWEGGEGERNKAFMSKKDPRKYKDSKNKTHSRKALRVGPKPWRKRQNKPPTTNTAKPAEE